MRNDNSNYALVLICALIAMTGITANILIDSEQRKYNWDNFYKQKVMEMCNANKK